MTKRLPPLVLVLTLLASGGYVFVYLYRWEWHRALLALGVFLAAEVAAATALVLRRLGRPDARRTALEGPRRRPDLDPQVLRRVQQAPSATVPFRWAGPPPSSTPVFIPVLLGAGVVATGVAWVVERLAAATARPFTDETLVRTLSAVALPEDGFVLDDALLVAGRGAEPEPDVQRLLGRSSGREAP